MLWMSYFLCFRGVTEVMVFLFMSGSSCSSFSRSLAVTGLVFFTGLGLTLALLFLANFRFLYFRNFFFFCSISIFSGSASTYSGSSKSSAVSFRLGFSSILSKPKLFFFPIFFAVLLKFCTSCPFSVTLIGGKCNVLPPFRSTTYLLLILERLSPQYLCLIPCLGSCLSVDSARYIFCAIFKFAFSILSSSFFRWEICKDFIFYNVLGPFFLITSVPLLDANLLEFCFWISMGSFLVSPYD